MSIKLEGVKYEDLHALPVAAGSATVEWDVGEALWWDDANTTINSASNFTWDTDAPTTRQKFKRLFVGMAAEAHRTDDSAGVKNVAKVGRITATAADADGAATGRAFAPGELLGMKKQSGNLLEDAILVRVQDPSEAIAEVDKDYTTVVTELVANFRGALTGVHFKPNLEKRTLQIYIGDANAAVDWVTDAVVGELFGCAVEILAISFRETIALTAADNIITMDKAAVSSDQTLTVPVSGAAIGRITRQDMAAATLTTLEYNDTLTFKSDGGSSAGEGVLSIEYRPL